MKIDILLSGVGGQGVITMGIILGEICARRRVNIITAETHGMAQRMGAVEVFVRIGDVEAPLIPLASADYVVALEMIETLRAIRYIKKCGWVLISNIYLPPPRADRVPTREEIVKALSKLPLKILVIDVENIVNKLKDARVVNMAMLGALLSHKDISKILPIDLAEDIVQEMLGNVNREALVMGYEQAIEKLNNGSEIYISRECVDQSMTKDNDRGDTI